MRCGRSDSLTFFVYSQRNRRGTQRTLQAHQKTFNYPDLPGETPRDHGHPALLRSAPPRACGTDAGELAASGGALGYRRSHWQGKAHTNRSRRELVKATLDVWLIPAGIESGPLFRCVCRAGKPWGHSISEKTVWHDFNKTVASMNIPRLAPYVRKSCARLCHDSGGELEQIQFLLRHVSVQTTERYIGCQQRLRIAVDGRLSIEPGRVVHSVTGRNADFTTRWNCLMNALELLLPSSGPLAVGSSFYSHATLGRITVDPSS